MPNHNFYEESGNLIMRGTKEYERALKGFLESQKESPKNMEKELRSLKKKELIEKFHEMIDPDRTENVSDETKDRIIERIIEFMKDFSGGRRRKTRKVNRKMRKTRKH